MEEKKELWMVQTKRADFSGLAMRLGVSPVAVRVMRNRGLTEEAEMRKYLYGTLDDLYDPRLMKGMDGGGADRKKAERGKACPDHRGLRYRRRALDIYFVKGISAGGKRTIAAVLIGGRPIQRRERK